MRPMVYVDRLLNSTSCYTILQMCAVWGLCLPPEKTAHFFYKADGKMERQIEDEGNNGNQKARTKEGNCIPLQRIKIQYFSVTKRSCLWLAMTGYNWFQYLAILKVE